MIKRTETRRAGMILDVGTGDSQLYHSDHRPYTSCFSIFDPVIPIYI